MRDLLGGIVIIRTRDKDLAARTEGNQFAIPAQVEIPDALEVLFLQLFQRLVVHDADLDFLGLPANPLGIDLPHVTIAKRSLVGHRQEAHRMRLESSDRFHLFHIVDRSLIDIEATPVPFTQKHHLPISRKVTGIPILPHVGRQEGVGLLLGIVIDDVTGHRRDVVLAPDVLAALAVIV